jgi:hypothetical protein
VTAVPRIGGNEDDEQDQDDDQRHHVLWRRIDCRLMRPLADGRWRSFLVGPTGRFNSSSRCVHTRSRVPSSRGENAATSRASDALMSRQAAPKAFRPAAVRIRVSSVRRPVRWPCAISPETSSRPRISATTGPGRPIAVAISSDVTVPELCVARWASTRNPHSVWALRPSSRFAQPPKCRLAPSSASNGWRRGPASPTTWARTAPRTATAESSEGKADTTTV